MSEKLTESRRAALRERGIFPRATDLNVLFTVIGALFGYRMLDLNLLRQIELEQIILLSLVIPFFAALGSVFATLIQSRFLFHFAFGMQKDKRNLADIFYILIKIISVMIIVALVFKDLMSSVETDSILISYLFNRAISIVLALMMIFGLVGFLVSRLTFIARHQMSRAEIEADSSEGEMRPELKAAMESGYMDDEE